QCAGGQDRRGAGDRDAVQHDQAAVLALGLIIMFCGLMTTRVLIAVGAALMVFSLYSWLLSPLEPEHH
ncbi:MAG TPA: hypothetical protein VGQ98_02175, partial [Gemmatimonadaceae bacterium]|nr:hypothetical protein [Gemmatimonadaceae bacterium]